MAHRSTRPLLERIKIMPMQDMMGEGVMGQKPPMNEGGDAGPDYGEGEEALSVFLPAKAFGNRPPKVGDSLSDFKIVDIDPETGEVEAQCSYEDKPMEKPGYEAAFDKAMPEEG